MAFHSVTSTSLRREDGEVQVGLFPSVLLSLYVKDTSTPFYQDELTLRAGIFL